jgi:hypothetical protein
MGCGSACSDNFVLSILPTWNQNFFFTFARENSPVQPLLLFIIIAIIFVTILCFHHPEEVPVMNGGDDAVVRRCHCH